MDRVEGLDGRKLKEDVLKYCEANNMTMGAFATKAKVAESTISKLDKGGVSSRTVALVKQAMSNYRPKKYIMSIERDGVVKYCHSYSQEIALQIIEESIENSWKGVYPLKGKKKEASLLDQIMNA